MSNYRISPPCNAYYLSDYIANKMKQLNFNHCKFRNSYFQSMPIATERHYSYENIGIFPYLVRNDQSNMSNLYISSVF